MVVTFCDCVNELRNDLERQLRYICDSSRNEFDERKKVNKYFRNLQDENYSLYAQIMGLLVSDHYKLLYSDKLCNELSQEDSVFFDIYESLVNNEDLVNFVEFDDSILFMLIGKMHMYNLKDYYTKRSYLEMCLEKLPLLIKFSSLNALDYLYYCQKYNIDLFKKLFQQAISDGDDKKDTLLDLALTLDCVFYDDNDNYFELIADLLASYYMIEKHKLESNKSLKPISKEIVSFLEKNDIVTILQKINIIYDQQKNEVNEFVFNMLEQTLDYNQQNISLNNADEVYQKTITKINTIKEFSNERKDNLNS